MSPRLQASIDLAAYRKKHKDNPRIIEAMDRQGITKAQKGTVKGQQYGKATESLLESELARLGVPVEPQYPWGKELDPPRKYTADVRISGTKILVESVGLAHKMRVNTDTERSRLAIQNGWLIWGYSKAEIESGEAAKDVAARLQAMKEER